LLSSSEEDYYFRYLDGKTPRIKFNIPDAGIYETNVPIEIVKIVPIEIPDHGAVLPPADRDRWKDCKMIYNPEMDKITSTPIRIFTEPGIIEYGPRFKSFIKPIQKFLIFHEWGHLFYSGEEDCDFYALVNFVRAGYNQSTGLYSLSHILKRSPGKITRLKSLLNNIQKIKQ
jgi:hypothetical protein